MSFTGLTPSFIKSLIANMELDTDVHYFGDKDTDGSWRVIRDSGTLKIQERAAGVWALRLDASTGSGATTLDGLSDVNTAGSADGDVLTFNSATSQWLPAAPTGGGGTAIPTSSTFKTTSYTIPVGKYAKATPNSSITQSSSSINMTVASQTTSLATISKWTINGNTVYVGARSGTVGVGANNQQITLPTECIAEVTYTFTLNGSAGGLLLQLGGTDFLNVTVSGTFSTRGYIACTGQVIRTVWNTGGASCWMHFNFTGGEPSEYILKSGDVISGLSTFKWFVEEYDV